MRRLPEAVAVGKGDVFERWTVISEQYRGWKWGKELWIVTCQCVCGIVREQAVIRLCNGSTRSCGCLLVETLKQPKKATPRKQSPLYSVWCAVKSRCYNPKNDHYASYGGRGITVCEAWNKDFMVFEAWAFAAGYQPGLTIDRIDNEQGYFPENCRFITRQEQMRNTTRTVWITAFGETKCLKDWGEDSRCAVHFETIIKRIRYRGMIPEMAITMPGITTKKA
jgi:hypothetical protein